MAAAIIGCWVLATWPSMSLRKCTVQTPTVNLAVAWLAE
jgi:hypothetical protein